MDFTGGTLQLTFADGEQAQFTPAQLHFHSPSEHTVDGVHYDLEMHIVHTYMDGSLGGVLGIFFDVEVGVENPQANEFINSLRFADAVPAPGFELGQVDLASYLSTIPMDKFWSYNGSLTTPLCTEGIKWTVLDTVQPLS